MEKLSLFAKMELLEVVRQTEHVITLEDFDDIAKINRLCLIINGEHRESYDILNIPVSIGGYELRQPVLGAMEWYDEHFLPLFMDNSLWCDVGLAMLMHNPDDPLKFYKLNTKPKMKKAVKAFWRKISCTHEKLRNALEKILGKSDSEQQDEDEDGKPEEKQESVTGGLLAMLVKEYGESPEYWLWKAPIGIVKTYVDAYVYRVEAEVQAVRHSIKTGTKPPPAPTMIQKLDDLREAKNKIRKKWQNGE